ncbi:hypothetical protein ME121_6540 [Methylobacterium sp. ME121]|nr:hypothetical protein ME121_6540 [Methylobacterium sp. ME121]
MRPGQSQPASSPSAVICAGRPARAKGKSRAKRGGIASGKNIAFHRSGSSARSLLAPRSADRASPPNGSARGPNSTCSSRGSGKHIGATATMPATSSGWSMP